LIAVSSPRQSIRLSTSNRIQLHRGGAVAELIRRFYNSKPNAAARAGCARGVVLQKLRRKVATFIGLVGQGDWRGVGYRFAHNLPWLLQPRWFDGLPSPASRAPTFQRFQYKDVWNLAAANEDKAKGAVSGSTDEAELLKTGHMTKDLLQRVVGIRLTDVILEIGAGVGRCGVLIAPLCREWIAADVSENMLVHLKRRLAHLPNVRTVALNGYDLSGVPSSSIDVVYCTVVFMHLDEWERFSYVRESFRVLKPGGRIYIDNFDLTSDEGWALFMQVSAIPPAERPAAVSKSSTPTELETYLFRAGFQAISTDRGGVWVWCAAVKPPS
jgi:ubiquinone/menaquinone biosynthesis C-methylase UbiE